MVMVILREAAAGLYLLSPGTDTFHFHTNRIKFFNSSLNIFIDIYCSLPFIYLFNFIRNIYLNMNIYNSISTRASPVME